MLACSEELIEPPPPSLLRYDVAVTLSKCMASVLFIRNLVNAFGTANSWLMCSYDSTCDHLPLADLCLKEATHPQFEADSISVDSLPPRRVRQHFTNSLASLFSKKQRILSPFSPVSEGRENIFDPSSQLPRNI